MANADTAVIVGRALVSSLGLDVRSACAAARAGIVRTSEAEHFVAADDENVAGAPIAVHSVPGLTRGFEGPARLTRLLTAGLENLLAELPDVSWPTVRSALFLGLPSPRRETEGAALLASDEERARFRQMAASFEGEQPDKLAQRMVAEACALAGFPAQVPVRFVDTSGTTAMTLAVAAAVESLRRGDLELAIVAGVDSLVGASTLEWFDRTARLRTPVRPAGLHPGEACALLVLESAAGARARGAAQLAGVEASVSEVEPKPLLSGEVSNGAALAATIDRLRAPAGWDGRAPWLTLDLNGENGRAVEWGHALTHLIARSATYHDAMLTIPAMSFGDTGAASGGVAACVALHAFWRGCAPSQNVAIINASDFGARTGLLLRASAAR